MIATEEKRHREKGQRVREVYNSIKSDINKKNEKGN